MSCGASRRIRPPHCLTNPSVACNSSSAPLCFTPDSPSLSSFLPSSRPLTFWCLIPSRLPLPSHSSRWLLFPVAPHHLLRTLLSLHSAVLLIQSLFTCPHLSSALQSHTTFHLFSYLPCACYLRHGLHVPAT